MFNSECEKALSGKLRASVLYNLTVQLHKDRLLKASALGLFHEQLLETLELGYVYPRHINTQRAVIIEGTSQKFYPPTGDQAVHAGREQAVLASGKMC